MDESFVIVFLRFMRRYGIELVKRSILYSSEENAIELIEKKIADVQGNVTHSIKTKKSQWDIRNKNLDITDFLSDGKRKIVDSVSALYLQKSEFGMMPRLIYAEKTQKNEFDKTLDVFTKRMFEKGQMRFDIDCNTYVADVASRGVWGAYINTIPLLWFSENGHLNLNDPETTLFSLAYFVSPVVIGFVPAIFGKYLGKKADEVRLKKLPVNAKYYKYGPEAIKFLEERYSHISKQARMNTLYKDLRRENFNPTKEFVHDMVLAFSGKPDLELISKYNNPKLRQNIPIEPIAQSLLQSAPN